MSIRHYVTSARMSKVVVAGGFAFLSGLTAQDRTGGVKEQTSDILAQLDSYLKLAGTDKSKLVSVNIWISDISTFEEMNAEWEAWVDPDAPPARATVEAALNHPDIKVEIMAQALI